MKIAILQGAFLPVPPVLGGGAERMWYALAIEFVRKGHEVVYVSRCYPGMPEEELREGIWHRRVRGYKWPNSLLRLKYLDLLYTLRARSVVPQDADVVVTNTFWAPLLFSSRLKKCCLVDVARMPKGQMRLYHEVARLRANSSPVATAIREEIPSNQHTRVVFIPNPLPFQNMSLPDFSKKKPVILYSGRLHPEKGLHLLIEAFKALDTDWKLRIVGPWQESAGGGGEEYLSSLKRLASGSTVEFTGPIHDSELLNKSYAEAAIFVYPSVAEQGETFGLAPLEAMSWGCATIVSDLACFQDFITSGKNGLIFNHRSDLAVNVLKEALERLTQDENFRFQLAQEALQVRESHSTAFIAACFLEEFERISEETTTLQTALI